MGLLIETQPGYASLVPDVFGGSPLALTVGGFDYAPWSLSVVTQMSIRRQANVQFVHTLQDLIYVYSFGERIGSITVAGLSFVGMCDEFGDTGMRTGIEYVLDWYDANEVGNGVGPLWLAIGGASGSGIFRAYLTGLEVDIVKPDLRLTSFALQFQALPRRRSG
jgi:hypothetical protein